MSLDKKIASAACGVGLYFPIPTGKLSERPVIITIIST